MTNEETINELNLMEMATGTIKATEAVKIASAVLRAQQELESNLRVLESNPPLTLDGLPAPPEEGDDE